MSQLLHNHRQMGVLCDGLCWIVAALLTLRVKDRGAEKELAQPESWTSPTDDPALN